MTHSQSPSARRRRPPSRLVRRLPPLRPALAAEHGPLLVLGFLGTQIGLERAVALRRGWAHLTPASADAGALWLIAGAPATAGRSMLALGGAVLVIVFVVVHRLHASWHNAVIGLGALTWPLGALTWLAGATLAHVVPWLVGFLVLTILGERLELSRMRRPPARALLLLLTAVAVFSVGVALAATGSGLGVRLAGLGLLGQAAWLARYDVARRTVRIAGGARYMAVALMAGYAWLAVAGAVWLADGTLTGGGFGYDAMIHAIFLGFVFSMVFAHAPVIVPAVLGVALPYRPVRYVPLALLRRAGRPARRRRRRCRCGGALNDLAIVTFLAVAVAIGVRARRQQGPRRPVRAVAPAGGAREELASS